MAVILKCPVCEQKFRWDFAAQDKWPKHCPACGEHIGVEDDTVICMPSLRSAKTDRTDQVYRDIEKGSETRMHLAAEAAGVSPSEMSGLKISDLKTNIAPGETYVREVSNTVTAQMDAMRAQGKQVGFTGVDGAAFAAGVRAGPHPNAGAKTLGAIQRLAGKG